MTIDERPTPESTIHELIAYLRSQAGLQAEPVQKKVYTYTVNALRGWLNNHPEQCHCADLLSGSGLQPVQHLGPKSQALLLSILRPGIEITPSSTLQQVATAMLQSPPAAQRALFGRTGNAILLIDEMPDAFLADQRVVGSITVEALSKNSAGEKQRLRDIPGVGMLGEQVIGRFLSERGIEIAPGRKGAP